MTTILLAQLWWLMPIFIGLVYLALGFIIAKHMIKEEVYIKNAFDYWLVLLFWLPGAAIGGTISLIKFLAILPKRFAENQINKQ